MGRPRGHTRPCCSAPGQPWAFTRSVFLPQQRSAGSPLLHPHPRQDAFFDPHGHGNPVSLSSECLQPLAYISVIFAFGVTYHNVVDPLPDHSCSLQSTQLHRHFSTVGVQSMLIEDMAGWDLTADLRASGQISVSLHKLSKISIFKFTDN